MLFPSAKMIGRGGAAPSLVASVYGPSLAPTCKIGNLIVAVATKQESSLSQDYPQLPSGWSEVFRDGISIGFNRVDWTIIAFKLAEIDNEAMPAWANSTSRGAASFKDGRRIGSTAKTADQLRIPELSSIRSNSIVLAAIQRDNFGSNPSGMLRMAGDMMAVTIQPPRTFPARAYTVKATRNSIAFSMEIAP